LGAVSPTEAQENTGFWTTEAQFRQGPELSDGSGQPVDGRFIAEFGTLESPDFGIRYTDATFSYFAPDAGNLPEMSLTWAAVRSFSTSAKSIDVGVSLGVTIEATAGHNPVFVSLTNRAAGTRALVSDRMSSAITSIQFGDSSIEHVTDFAGGGGDSLLVFSATFTPKSNEQYRFVFPSSAEGSVVAIPEPSSWAIMSAGLFAVLGYALRRRGWGSALH
jgi:hypothetical protein